MFLHEFDALPQQAQELLVALNYDHWLAVAEQADRPIRVASADLVPDDAKEAGVAADETYGLGQDLQGRSFTEMAAQCLETQRLPSQLAVSFHAKLKEIETELADAKLLL